MEEANLYQIGRFDVSAIGSNAQLRLGDINGDGRLEMVLLQADEVIDDAFLPHSLTAAIAYTLEGEVLWQIGKPNPGAPVSKTDIPAQIYDIDRDGMNEFICVMDGFLCIYDGMTAELKRQIELPAPYAHDCIVIADVEGKGYAQNLILKNRYHQLWVLDANFNVLWTFKGNIGNVPVPYDLNGDGKDEIIAGKVILNHEGEVIAELELPDHPQSIVVGDLAQTVENIPVILCGGKETTAFDKEGKKLWSLSSSSITDCLTIGDFRKETQGNEISGFYSGEEGGVFLTDYHGNSLFKETRTGLLEKTSVQTIFNFDGTRQDMILLSGRQGATAGIFDGYFNPLYVFPVDGKAYSADLLGDGIPEVLILHDGVVDIFAARPVDLGKACVPYSRPQTKRRYNDTIFAIGARESAPYAFSYATGCFAETELAVWAEQTALNPDMEMPISRGDFLVLAVEALELYAYDYDGFFDVSPKDYFYDAISTVKKLGYIDEIVGRFAPKQATTAEFAISILEQAGITPIMQKSGTDELTYQDAAKLILQIFTQKRNAQREE